MTTKAAKPVAKSLHTITVIVQVAKLHGTGRNPIREDVARAMETLGLSGRDDPYNLAAIAAKQLGL